MTDTMEHLAPVMLRRMTWAQARRCLSAVDCAIRRDHWCSPVVVLIDGLRWIDSDGDLLPFSLHGDDATASDWSMVPRVDDDGNDILVTYRAALTVSPEKERK